MAPSDWYYAKGNRQLGPVSSTELKQLSESGELTAEDLVWREGMVEWIAAGKVTGLFSAPVEEPSPVESPAIQTSPAGAASDGPAPAGAAPAKTDRPSDGSRKHVFDMLIELIRRQFSPRFVDSSSDVFAATGYYGLYIGMGMLLVFGVVIGAEAETPTSALATSASEILLLVVLQYASGRFLASIQTLNRRTSGRIASTAIPDCVALSSICLGLALLIGMVILGLVVGDFTLVLFAIGLFILCEYIAVLAVTLDALNIEVATDAPAGEEAIGILSFLAKLTLRLVPVAFGVGVVLGICNLLVASLLVTTGSAPESIDAVAAVTAASGILVISAALPIARLHPLPPGLPSRRRAAFDSHLAATAEEERQRRRPNLSRALSTRPSSRNHASTRSPPSSIV